MKTYLPKNECIYKRKWHSMILKTIYSFAEDIFIKLILAVPRTSTTMSEASRTDDPSCLEGINYQGHTK